MVLISLHQAHAYAEIIAMTLEIDGLGQPYQYHSVWRIVLPPAHHLILVHRALWQIIGLSAGYSLRSESTFSLSHSTLSC